MLRGRTWVEIDRRALRSNLRQYRQLLPAHLKIAPVVKANAYGHGTRTVVQTLRKEPIWGFCVASGEEALELREFFPGNVLVLSSWQSHELPALIRTRVALVVWDAASARTVNRTARRLNRRAAVHLKVDTGAGRIGVLPEDAPATLEVIRGCSGLSLTGCFTHFAAVEENQIRFTERQLRRFERAGAPLPAGVLRHATNTAAITRSPRSWHSLIRLGIGLYGLWPSEITRRYARRDRLPIRLTPALSWRTRLLQVKRLPRGATVGYGRTFRTSRPTTLGVIPVGYWDGYDRLLGNRGVALVHGRRVQVAGRISMNLTMLDLTHVHGVRAGEIVTLIGHDRSAAVSAEELAEATRTINYEVVTRINAAIPRVPV